jgi:choline dehydrogenase-like flavoprotein
MAALPNHEFEGGDQISRPGSEVQPDEEIEALIRKTDQTVSHPVGTAAMLDGEVVDADLKVYHGTANVPVVRISVFYVSLSF